jgi:dihydropyrimidine dehydrogenase (NAD+) subunit PreT
MSEPVSFFTQAPTPPETAARFPDLHPAFNRQAAVPEANRCLFCFDAPCMQACPTHIDVPRFIKKIASGNLAGSAQTILEANILGASCSRACPVDVLCEGACVMHRYNKQPIEIARLQRFAMDAFHAGGDKLPFTPAPDTGRKVALIGGGPASLACAAELRSKGIAATIYDARPLPGGLNSYGIAEYKLPLAESLREIDMIARLGVEFRFDTTVDAATLAELEATHDAMFVGAGLGAAVRLGAEEVYMVYRRGPEQMSAFSFEYEHAKQEGVRFHWHKAVAAVEGADRVEGIRVTHLEPASDGSIVPVPGSEFSVRVGMVVLAIGQATHTGFLADAGLDIQRGRIAIDRVTGQTSNPKYFAGGDCTNGGREVVDAVADGKRAGLGIAAWLEERDGVAHGSN